MENTKYSICKSVHFYRKVGKRSVCMYCGNTRFDIWMPYIAMPTFKPKVLTDEEIIKEHNKIKKEYGL